MGAKVRFPGFDSGVDARVGFHRSYSFCQHLHDVVKPELIHSILEKIENLLGVFHSDREWFPSLLRLGGLGPLVLDFFCVECEQLCVVVIDNRRVLCGGGFCGGSQGG